MSLQDKGRFSLSVSQYVKVVSQTERFSNFLQAYINSVRQIKYPTLVYQDILKLNI